MIIIMQRRNSALLGAAIVTGLTVGIFIASAWLGDSGAARRPLGAGEHLGYYG